MMHKCAWCGRAATTEAAEKATPVSHGICAGCLAEMLEEVFGVGRKENEERPPLPSHFREACATV
jgi:hypothetical protein